jgi:hypothetical protein
MAVSAGRRQPSQPRSNPVGRPTKLDSTMRQIRAPLIALGATESEIRAIGIAFAEESMLAIKIVMGIIATRFDARAALAAQAASPDAKRDSTDPFHLEGLPDGDIF